MTVRHGSQVILRGTRGGETPLLEFPLTALHFGWHDQAECRALGPDKADETFFPAKEDRTAVRQASDNHCSRCPVRQQCLTSALEGDEIGIFAGTSTKDRRLIRRARTRRKCPVCKSRSVVAMDGASVPRPAQVCLACALSWTAENMPAELAVPDAEEAAELHALVVGEIGPGVLVLALENEPALADAVA